MSDLISRQAAIDLVRDVCDAVMSGCESWYDPDTGDEVYKDILEVDSILKCNKEIRIALRSMPSAQLEHPIINIIDDFKEKTGCEEVIIVNKDTLNAWDENGVEYTMQPEQKQGEWIEEGEKYGEQMWRCSECKIEEAVPTATSFITGISYPQWHFCPNCGADMRGDNNV